MPVNSNISERERVDNSVTAEACANIAFIKYWGNRPEGGNLPLNVSISMNLAGCVSRTTVEEHAEDEDAFFLNDDPVSENAQRRVGEFLDAIRKAAGRSEFLSVRSTNNFPTGCGIASSASGFAALATASAVFYGMSADEQELSRLARLGSGSAARSVPSGFVELLPAESHEGAYARSLAAPEDWPDLRDLIVVLSQDEKATSSLDGHRLAHTSEMLAGRLAAIPDRVERVRQAIRERDLTALGEASEADAVSMHAVMMTSQPPLHYWLPRTLEVLRTVWELRKKGTEVYFTMDAGPNVHLLLLEKDVAAVEQLIADELSCRTLTAQPGPAARIVSEEEA